MKKFFETFIIIAIFLVIIQTFLDEYSRFAHWSVRSRNILLITGFCFDFIFSTEFTVRSIFSGREGRFFAYVRFERGWVDFISSFPLLLLDSGPSLIMLLTSDLHSGAGVIGVMNVLKVVKAVRITRILRLVRVVKIFGKIHNAESKMAQHHTAVITTTAVFAIVLSVLFFTIFTGMSSTHIAKERSAEYVNLVDGLNGVADKSGMGFREISESILMSDKNVLRVTYSSGDVVERFPRNEFKERYDEEDFIEIKGRECTALISITDINREISLEHIQIFLVIISVVVVFMVIYTRHFVQNISDPIHIMNLGFRKRDFNLMVKVPEEISGHEIFRLAGFYNDAYLPSKMRKMDTGSPKSGKALSMKDFMNFK